MQYGYFDEKNREYVITRPNTPAPWVNYLGSTEYGAIISNNAGGYSFRKSGAKGRILRYRFNSFDQPGRYIYLRDNETFDYWSASWQPVAKSRRKYVSECRHGLGYTTMKAEYTEIRSEVLYYIPWDQEYEVWFLRITNRSEQIRQLTVTGFAEFTNHPDYEQDMVNLQYSQFISQTHFHENRILQTIQENQKDAMISRFFGLAGADVSSYCGDLSEFLGPYQNYSNPAGVEKGNLGGVLNVSGNSCGALSTVVILGPGESVNMAFILGEKTDEEAARVMAAYEDPRKTCRDELIWLKTWWEKKLDNLQVKTPDETFNTMVNTWNAYNCFITFLWSRAASFVYCGLRNGYGYRDTVQDIQGIIHLDPEMAKRRLRFMLSAQADNGAGLPLVKFNHRPGKEDTPDDESYVKETGHPSYRADDALWLFPTVWKYLGETGNMEFLDNIVPYANRDAGTVYDHLKRALQFSANHLGPHGLPAGLYADWNDCLRLGENGESVFVAMQYLQAMDIMEKLAEHRKDTEYAEKLKADREELRKKIQELCWMEDRFIRGFREDGTVIGRGIDTEANLWLNPQSWSVISGAADPEQADAVLELVHEELNTPYGAMLMAPPYQEHAFPGALMQCYNPYTKENSGIFSQPQGWLILAEALRGHGGRAFEYFTETAPAAMNDQAEIRGIEPYAHGQFTEGKGSPHAGRSHVHWLTGTASTVMVGCVEGILGLRPEPDGLRLSPSIPLRWPGFTMEKTFRGKKLLIAVENPEHTESGCKELTLNGEKLEGNFISAEKLKDENEIVLKMS